ncbi:hypothetical protein FRC11_004272 [Ceratobasidium sp. 423]|nr:hypothetical protein FRC11_004272 [Ceratobasidium sp. 423]
MSIHSGSAGAGLLPKRLPLAMVTCEVARRPAVCHDRPVNPQLVPDLTMMHIGLIKELSSASDLLESAINRYTDACAAIFNYFEPSDNTTQDLLDSVLAEFPRASGYESKLQQATAFMCRVRNQSPSFVPINILPPEVMSRILWFSGRCCLPKSRWARRDAKTNSHLVYPEVALEVCYRWRQIVLASNDLWSHIDIDLGPGPEGSLFSRALAFAVRSNQAPINLHIKIHMLWGRNNQRLVDFFQTIAPRIRSFDLQWDSRSSLDRDALSWVASLFSWADPGTLRRLCINSESIQEPGFLVANDSTFFDRDSPLLQTIPLTELLFEGVLSSLTSMQLDGTYPYWTSRAYTGLIELDLGYSHKCETDIDITEVELANILRASPGLRVLRVSLKISFRSEDSISTPKPVHLSHLEVIRLDAKYPGAQEAVLRMICPGHVPLQVTTEVTEHFSWSSPYWVQFINFISRSKISQLQLQGIAPRPFKIFLEIPEILPLLSQLQVLTLNGLILGRAYEEILGDYDATSFSSLLHDYTDNFRGQNLRLVRLVNCRIYWADFRHMSDMHPMEILILDGCEAIKTRPQKRRFGQPWDWTNKLRDAATKICPSAVVELSGTRGEFEELSEFELGDWSKKSGRTSTWQ